MIKNPTEEYNNENSTRLIVYTKKKHKMKSRINWKILHGKGDVHNRYTMKHDNLKKFLK